MRTSSRRKPIWRARLSPSPPCRSSKSRKGMDPVVEERGLRLEQELHRMVEILIRKYEPEKLILFGSAAQGELHEWSDLDLVVIKRTDKPLLERIEEVLRLVRPKVGLDVLVYTPEEMEGLVADRRGFVVGEVIFKRAAAYEE